MMKFVSTAIGKPRSTDLDYSFVFFFQTGGGCHFRSKKIPSVHFSGVFLPDNFQNKAEGGGLTPVWKYSSKCVGLGFSRGAF